MSTWNAGHHNAGSITANGFQDQPWADRARCAEIGGDLWFPEKEGSGEAGQSHVRDAKAVCSDCPVRSECLDWALDTDQRFGVWGGHSPRERAKMPKPVVALAATGTESPTPVDETPTPSSYGGTYVAGGTHRPIPLATDIGVRRAHQPKTPRVTGLDWSKHTAPEPEKAAAPVLVRCRWCRTPQLDLVDDLCQACRDDAEKAFHAPDHTALGQELADLERTDPAVAAAAASYDDMVTRVTRPEDHIQAPREETPAPFEGVAAAGPQETTPTPRLDVVGHCAQLLRDTSRSTDPLVQMLRGSALSVLAALDHAHHPETPVAAASPGVAAPVERPVAGKAATGSPRPRAARRGPRTTVDLVKARQLLDQGHSCPEIAAELGVGVKAVRTALENAGIARPDGRTTHSGGQPRQYDAQTVADVRRLYLDEHLSRSQVADQLDLPYKTVVTIMAHHAIPARQRQAGNLDGARTLKDRIAALGVTSRDIKTWALAQGLITELKRGLPGLELVDAYAAAHPTNRKENQ